MIEILLTGTRKFSLWLTWIAGTLIVLSAFLVTIEVFLREIFNYSIGGADELSGYAFGVATALSLAYALFERAHIRVDVAYNFFPKHLKTFVNYLGLLLLVGFAAIVATMAWSMVEDTLQYGSRSITPMRTPLAIPQIPWLFGWIFFVFSGLLIALVALVRMIKGDHQGSSTLIGIKSIDEQIEDEVV
jgi:TRAP-type C4-dicarboxylate transport system permease small subunit